MSHGNAMDSKPSSGCISKGNYICTAMLISGLFTINKVWIHSKCSSTDEWIKKSDYIFLYPFISQTHTHTQDPAICNNMNMEDIRQVK